MGKYVREAKITGDVAVMELSQSTVGVRTRAKTLALQRCQSPAPPPPTSADTSYLQLRSRRLEKLPPPAIFANSKKAPKRNQKPGSKQNLLEDHGSMTRQNSDAQFSSRFRVSSTNSGLVNRYVTEDGYFGENILECESTDRFTRETTPCSLVREADDVKTPSSTTRRTNLRSTTHRMRNSARNIPPTGEMDEFFGYAEQQQQAVFIEKYNFDIVNDLPLPGRYEWASVSQ